MNSSSDMRASVDLEASLNSCTVDELLSHLSANGISISVDDGHIRVSAPKGALSAEFKALLASRKPELLAVLAQRRSVPGAGQGVVPVSKAEPVPLSFGQERLWFLEQLEPGQASYNVMAGYRLQGSLDVQALVRALNEVVVRHEVLRTAYILRNGHPMQVLGPASAVELAVVDLTGEPEEEQESAVMRIAMEERLRPFDLSQDLMMRGKLLRLADEDHALLLTLHHIASDGWSMGLLWEELAALYAAFARGEESPLPELLVQYADYAVWQRAWLQGEELERQLAYWRSQLAGLGVLELPTDRPRPTVQSFRGATYRFDMPARLVEKIRALAQREGATLYMLLLAAFQTLLFRYTGQEDIAVGTPVAGRNRVEIEKLLGFFVNTLVMRGDLTGDPTFQELLARIRRVALGAYSHQDLPFEKLVAELQPERSLSTSPLFQVLFVLHEDPAARLVLPDVEARQIEIDSVISKYDLSLSLLDQGSKLRGRLVYDATLFDRQTMRRFVDHFLTLLGGVVAEVGGVARRISQLPILTAEERQRLLRDWNQTAAAYAADRCYHELFEDQVARTPTAPAIILEPDPVFSGSKASVSYAELNERANRLAEYLGGLGVGPEAMVGICIEPSLEMLVAILGTWKAGGAYLPIDPSDPPSRIALILEDSGVRTLLTQARVLSHVGSGFQRVSSVTGATVTGQDAEETPSDGRIAVCLDSDWPLIAEEQRGPTLCRPAMDPGNLAYVIYTSGSTGTPKGTLVEHRSLINYLTWVNGTLMGEEPCALPTITKPTFDASLKQLLAPLLRGDAVWLVPTDMARRPEALLDLLRSRDRVGLNCVPALWSVILDVAEAEGEALPSFSHLFLGGEQLSAELVVRTLRSLPRVRIWNLYGPSEATANASAALIEAGEQVTIGHPIANTQLYIVDRNLQPTPIGVPGELCIGGDGVGRGYLKRPDLSAEKFSPDPFAGSPGARLYLTGDRARFLPDGSIEFLGRVDDQVKIRGFRVELGEIEAMLRSYPGIREAVVLAHGASLSPDELVAYVVPSTHQLSPSVDDLGRFLRDHLPEYMVPAALVTLDSLPVTPTGKVDRKSLRQMDLASVARTRMGESSYQAPRTPTQEIVAGIWTELLRGKQVGLWDSFFDLGGHSLLAIQMLSRIRSIFDIDLPLRTLFETPTVADLARQIDDGRSSSAGGPPESRRAGSRSGGLHLQPQADCDSEAPLSFGQERLWFLDQLEGEQAIYNVMAAYRLRGNLDVKALERALTDIVARHEVLRTVIIPEGGKPVQVVRPAREMRLELVRLPEGSETEREKAALDLALAERRRRFDLAQDLMIRGTLIELGSEDYIFLLSHHHIASDAWSMGVLWEELAILYERYAVAASVTLPELALQYRDYAVWQREQLHKGDLARHMEYWRRHLAGIGNLALPADRPRPVVQSYRGAAYRFILPEELVAGLQALARQEGATLYMALLAAFQVLLWRYSGQEDIAVGTPIAGRNGEEVEKLIGFFVNTLVMRTDLTGDPTFAEVLARVRRMALEAYDHQDLPFEKLVQELQPERQLNRNPLFQVLFQLYGFESRASQLGEVTVEALTAPVSTARFDLEVSLRHAVHGLAGSVIYSTDLFDEATIARMVGHFRVLLESIVADSRQPISRLHFLTQDEHRQLLGAWSKGPGVPLPDGTILDILAAQVALTPDAVAVVAPPTAAGSSGAQQSPAVLTYAQLDDISNRYSHHLRNHGLHQNPIVGLLASRSVDAVTGLLAVLKGGGAYLPLDPSLPQERLGFMLQDSGSRMVLAQEELLDHLPGEYQRVGQLNSDLPEGRLVLCLVSDSTAIGSVPVAPPSERPSPDQLAYVMYTSGSTGKPKGVAMPHRALANLVSWHQVHPELGQPARTLQYASLSFDVSFQEIFSTWCTGGVLVLVDEDTRRDPNALCALLKAYQVERLFLPVAALQQIAQVIAADSPDGYSLRMIITAGEQLRITESVRQMMAKLPRCTLHNHYGPTEAHVVTEHVLRGSPISWPELPPIGRPIANAHLLVLDQHQQLLPVGIPGELYIGGVCVAEGYLHRPELTQQRFLIHPLLDGERLYRTGDLGRWRPDGTLEYLGRLDHQVKVRGFRVELGEVEATLAQHPSVEEAIVAVREPRPVHIGDEARQKLIAYLVLRPGYDFAVTEARAFLRQWLPDYMVPGDFVILEAFPLNRNGKVDRSALPEPQPIGPLQGDRYAAPRTSEELFLVRQWESVLDRRPIGINDDFFDLGGHSLLGVRLFAQIERETGIRLPLALLFQAPTVSQLASYLQKSAPLNGWQTIVPIQAEGSRPPFFCVHGFGGGVLGYADLARLMGPDQPFFGLQAIGLDGIAPPDETIVAMANRYVQALRQVQVDGPYYVGGYCLGGVVAYEMAKQLETQGERVALLAIMEGFAPARFRTRIPLYDPQRLVTLWRSLPYWAKDYWELGGTRLSRHARARLRNHWHRATGQATQRDQVRLAELVDADLSQVPEYHQRLMLIHLRALRDYAPEPFSGKVTLFRARWQTVNKVLFGAMDPTYGWDRLALGGVEVRLVDGSHRNVHLPPQVTSLAQQLRASIGSATGH
jgi:amino acid adenylation domain-containing protein